MRSSAEIRDFVTDKMVGMIKYPKMWADTAIGLETEYVQMLALVLFIDEVETDRIIAEWCRFAHHEIGFSGPEPVAVWLRKHEQLDDDWRSLTNLLNKFYSFMTFVPVSA